MSIFPHETGFGATVEITDINELYSEQAGPRLMEALNRFQILVFTELSTDLQLFSRFARSLGRLVRHDFVSGLSQDPYIHEIYKAPDHLQNFGESWHSDGAYLASPPRAVLLQALEVPQNGGDTLWCCQIAAYAALRHELQTSLQAHSVRHEAASVFEGYPEGRVKNVAKGANHPLYRWIPERKEIALFHSGHCARHIVGMPDCESAEYLDALLNAAVGPRQYRHAWRPGDLVLWDNRTTMHSALNDYHGAARRMRRAMIGGQKPVFPPLKADRSKTL